MPLGSKWVNIGDFGVVAGNAAAAASNRQAILNKAFPSGKNLYWPNDGAYCIDGPIYGVHDNVQMRGAGQTQVLMKAASGNVDASCLLLGLRNIPPPAGTYIPMNTLTSSLDSSVDTTRLYAIRLRKDPSATLWFFADCFAFGGYGTGGRDGKPDHWATPGGRYTLDAAFQAGNGGPLPASGSIMGLGIGVPGLYSPSPWVLCLDNGQWTFVFNDNTVDAGGLPAPRQWRFTWPYNPATTGMHRLAIQIDFSKNPAVVSAYLNGAAVSFNTAPTLTGVTGFQRNDIAPFRFGCASYTYNTGAATDLVLCGLRFSNTLRYAQTAGGAWAKSSDGTPVNDRYAYQTYDGNTTAWLPLATAAGMEVPAQCNGSRNHIGFLISDPRANNGVSSVTISDMQFTAASGWYGAAVGVGAMMHLAFRDCAMLGGGYGLASLNSSSNVYHVDLERCSLQGRHANLYLYNTVCYAKRPDLGALGRSGIYGHSGSVLNIRDLTMNGPSEHCEYYINWASTDFSGGGDALTIDGWSEDNEGWPQPTKAVFSFAPDPQGMPGLFSLKNMRLAYWPPTVPWIVLGPIGKSPAGQSRMTSLFQLENVSRWGQAPVRPLIQVRDSGWTGDVRGIVGNPASWIEDLTPSGCGIKTHHSDFGPLPPRTHSWVAGSHEVRVTNPAPGQFSGWKCVRSGTEGTTSPPVWVGVDPLAGPGSNVLAGYVQDRMILNLGPDGGQGEPGTQVSDNLLRLLFGNAGWTPPGTYYLGLSTTPANKDQSNRGNNALQEPTSNGYTRVAIANGVFPDPMAMLLTFPTPTGPWTDRQGNGSLGYWVLSDGPTSGNVIARGKLASPIAVADVGPAPAFAAGALTVRHGTSPLGQFSTYLANQVQNLLLGGAALTPPATFYFGLSATRPQADGAGISEPAGGGYARAALANAKNNWWHIAPPFQAASDDRSAITQNSAAITFPTPLGAWTDTHGWPMTLAYWFAADAATGGNLLMFGPLTVPLAITAAGQPAPAFAPGALAITHQ